MIHQSFLAAVVAVSAAASAFAQTTVKLSLQVSGKTRSAMVHAPSGIDKPAVVFFVHGANGSGANFENETKGDVTADREKFIAVYPSASSDGGAGVWDDMYGKGNFPFFLALIDTVDARYHIDRNQVYMTGFSQGGMISFVAGCSYSDVFAAVAPVSGHSGTTCTLKRPMPMFMTFGAQEGAASFITDLNVWLKLNACPSASTITFPYPASKTNGKVSRVSYGPCSEGSYVLMDSIQGQGHQWPSSSNINQADEAWAFFKQYSLNKTTDIREQPALSADPVTVSYAAGAIRFAGEIADAQVSVTDAKGQVVATGAIEQRQFVFGNKPSGVYFVRIGAGERSVRLKFMVP